MSGIRVEREGPQGTVARVTLARPEVRNAFNAELIGELRTIFEGFAVEPAGGLRAVVLAGEGTAFCAGADVEWMRAAAQMDRAANEADAARMQAMFTAIDLCPAPVVARVHGVALGGGMGLCAVADVVLTTTTTLFGFTETRLGILPAVISPFVLPRIGEGNARALFTTGERFDGERAVRIGLATEALPDTAALDARLDGVVSDLLRAGPTAARAAKALIRELRSLPAADARVHTVRHIAQQRVSAEGQEGLAAFLEKRKPAWDSADS